MIQPVTWGERTTPSCSWAQARSTKAPVAHQMVLTGARGAGGAATAPPPAPPRGPGARRALDGNREVHAERWLEPAPPERAEHDADDELAGARGREPDPGVDPPSPLRRRR